MPKARMRGSQQFKQMMRGGKAMIKRPSAVVIFKWTAIGIIVFSCTPARLDFNLQSAYTPSM
jgi:hypothetical protein